MKIFLIGMPGSGKSTVGKQLATKLNIPFIDLDKEIEKREARSIKDIFSSEGEDYFRNTESEVLQQVAARQDDAVIATGGGAPCFHRGIDIINASGLSIFLDVAIDELVSRVEGEKERPLLRSTDRIELEEKLTSTRNKRLKYYQQANVMIPDPTIDSVYDAIRLKK